MSDFSLKMVYKKFTNSILGPLSYFIIFLAATAFFSILIKDSLGEQGVRKEWQGVFGVLALISSSFMVSFSIAFLERLGISGNLQEHISTEIEGIKGQIEEIIKSRLGYGLTAAKKGGNLEINIINKLEDGDKIYWIDTALQDLDKIMLALAERLKNKKIEVKILLMSPDNKCTVYRSRMAYSVDKHSIYVEGLRNDEKRIEARVEDIKNQKIKGNIEILYYMDMISFPLFIFEKPSKKYEVAYTGFYLNKLSSTTPYLKWESSSEEPFYLELLDYFNLRWEQEDNHVPRPDEDET